MKQSDIYRLHQKQAHGKYKKEMVEIGWTHSLIVRSIALQIAQKLEKEYGIKTDTKLIEIGALIHDIGFYKYFDDDYKIQNNYILHGRTGYEILIKEGVSKKRARFALTHVGVGYEKDIPISLEEEIVSYADKFHSKGHPRFNTYEESLGEMININPDYKVIMERYKDKFGIPDIKELEKKYKKWHKEINEWKDGIK
jgi:putative nucleotidyltransferase with HDIG domain